MPPLRRFLVSSLLASILGVHAFVALPGIRFGGWYWPFIDYPMYSNPHYTGEAVPFLSLAGIPCEGGPASAITPESLGIGWHRLNYLLVPFGDGDESTHGGVQLLRELTEERHGGRICMLRVHRAEVRLGEIPEGGVAAAPSRVAAEIAVPKRVTVEVAAP